MTKILLRKLILGAVLGVVTLLLLALLGATAMHAFGEHRLETARARFESRWGHMSPVLPTDPVPDDQNGALWLVAGGRAISVTLEDQKFYGDLMGNPVSAWTTAERARARRILLEQRHAVQLLLRIGTSPAFHMGTDGAFAPHDEVEFFAILKGIRLLVLDASLSLVDDRTADTLASLRALGRASDGLLKTPSMRTFTIGSAATRWTTNAAANLVNDPCTTDETLVLLQNALPSENPVHRGNLTLTTLITEIADEGLHYIDDLHDPSLGWSIPFWVSNRYLVEDWVVAGALESWTRYLELGQIPAADWPPETVHTTWKGAAWPPWIAMGGTWTPNLFGIWARAQAASSQLQQLDLALELRLASPAGVGPDSCKLVEFSTPTALTGTPIDCNFDEERAAIVLDLPGAETTLRNHLSVESRAVSFPVIVLPVGGAVDCSRPVVEAISPAPATAMASR